MKLSTLPSFSPAGSSTSMPSNLIVLSLSARSFASTELSHGSGRSIGILLPRSNEQKLRPPRYYRRMTSPAETAPAPQLRERSAIPERFKWDLSHIFPGWAEWQAAFDELERKIGAYAALQGTLAQGAERLLAAMKLSDEIGQLTYKVW